jgi:hypothetical protein
MIYLNLLHLQMNIDLLNQRRTLVNVILQSCLFSFFHIHKEINLVDHIHLLQSYTNGHFLLMQEYEFLHMK